LFINGHERSIFFQVDIAAWFSRLLEAMKEAGYDVGDLPEDPRMGTIGPWRF
jgi:hypothetical protein